MKVPVVPRPAPIDVGAPLQLAVQRLLKLLLALCLGVGLVMPVAWAKDSFLPPDQAFVATAAMADPLHLDFHFRISPGYYMYQERFQVQVEDARGSLLLYRPSTLTPPGVETRAVQWALQPELPRGEVKYDPTFDKEMEVYHDGVTLRIPLQASAAAPLAVTIIGQGCADQGICYPPMTQHLTLADAAGGYRAEGALVRSQVPPPRDVSAPADAEFPPGQPQAGGRLDLLAAAAADRANPVSAGADDGPSAAQAFGAPSGTDQPGTWLDLGDEGMAAWLHQAPLWQILALSLMFGALLSLTPCVLPMVPILLAVIAGRAGRGRGLSLAALYVFGMSLVYTALGIVAGLVGAGVAVWLQSPWVIGSFALLLAVFALAMLGAFTLQAPVGLQSAVQARLQKVPGGHAGGAFVMGLLSALIVGPCVAAPLAGVLLFISQTGDVVVGGSALFAMAWGEGLLLLAVGAGAGAALPRAGAWMDALKHGFGLLLLATAWWMARPLLGAALYVGGWVLLALWAALLLWQAAGLTGHTARPQDASSARPSAPAAAALAGPWRVLTRAVAVLVALWGLAQGAGLLAGGQDMLRPLAPFTGAGGAASAAGGTASSMPAADPRAIRARFTRIRSLADLKAELEAADRPVMLDFYADWCVSCLEMEKFTFSDPTVSARMDRMRLLQADVTHMTAEDRALLGQFNLFGPPGILFFAPGGALDPSQRVVGFLKADAFGRVQEKVLAAARR